MQIIEIAFELKDQEEYDFLENLLTKLRIPFYVEPQCVIPYRTLEELEADCEGK